MVRRASTTTNSTRGPSNYRRLHSSYVISPAASTAFAATRKASRSLHNNCRPCPQKWTHPGPGETIFKELSESLETTRRRLDAIIRQPLDLPIKIGRKGLPTTLAGLLIHAAEHTQRHVGQAITTAKVILAQRGPRCDPSSPA